MPLTREHTARYLDALVALAAATHRPANIVNLGDSYAIRVEFEFNRYLLATNSADGLSAEPVDGGLWSVQFCAHGSDGDEVLATAEHEWLVDAFDIVISALRGSDRWITSDMTFGELAPPS